MTINGYSSFIYPPSLGGNAASPVASGTVGFSPTANTAPTASGSAKATVNGSDKPAHDPTLSPSAEQKLQSIDPSLAQKLDGFHQQIDQLAQSGASTKAIAQAMKSDIDSLSAPEKSEVQSALESSKPHHHHHRATAASDSNTQSPTASNANSVLSPTAAGPAPDAASSSLTQLIDSFLKAQASSAYGKSESTVRQLQAQAVTNLAA